MPMSVFKKLYRMKILQIATIFSTLVISISVFGQNGPVTRQYSKAEKLTIDKGVMENMKYQLFRFTTALEEKDQKNVEVMKSVLMKAIEEEIGKMKTSAKENHIAAPAKKLLEDQLKLQKALTGSPFSVSTEGFEQSMKDKALFDDFIKNMEEEYTSLEQSGGQ